MNSLGIVPARSVFQLGLRGVCSQAATSRGASRLLSTCSSFSTRIGIYEHTSRRNPRPIIAPQWLGLRLHSRPYSSRFDIVIDRYEDLPGNYTDKEGLPFRKSDLSASEVKRIFGPGMKHASANRLLRILHGRRVAGTLDDPAYNGNTASYTQDEKLKALTYLRRTAEVDELLNAGLRAEDELRELEREAAGEGEEDNAASTGDAKPAARKPDPVYGESVFDEIRARNIAKREEAERIEAEERAERERLKPGPLATLDDKPRQLSPRMQKWTEQATSTLEAPPELTHFERLMPSTAFAALLGVVLAGFVAIYTPPGDHDRLFPEISPAHATVGALVALNLAVHLAWRVPPLWAILNRYFVMVHGAPRAPTLLTSVFSHQSFLWHFLPNMFGLCALGPLLHDDVGRAGFLAIYLAAGSVGFLGSLYWFTLRGLLTQSTIGASGAVYGVFGAYFWLHRFESFKVLGFPPEPLDGPQGLAFLAMAVALHVWAVFRKGRTITDYMSHMAGMATGIAGVHVMTRGQGRLADAGSAKPVELIKDVTVTKAGSGPRPA